MDRVLAAFLHLKTVTAKSMRLVPKTCFICVSVKGMGLRLTAVCRSVTVTS